MENKVEETKQALNNVKEAMVQEKNQNWEGITAEYLEGFEEMMRKTNHDLMMPESVFVRKYLPLFARLAVNKDNSVTATDAWKEWMSMTIGGTREVAIVADSDVKTNESEVHHPDGFPYEYVSYQMDPKTTKVLYKVPPIIGNVVVNRDNISERMKELGIPNIADVATAVKTQFNYTPATGMAMVNKTVSILGQNIVPDNNDYKERWKQIFYRYYKPEANKSQEPAGKEVTDEEYDNLW